MRQTQTLVTVNNFYPQLISPGNPFIIAVNISYAIAMKMKIIYLRIKVFTLVRIIPSRQLHVQS